MSSEAQAIFRNLARVPLSESLRHAALLANRSGNLEFARWCQLELAGYVSSNLTGDTSVPVYRTVSGQFTAISGIAVFSSDHAFSEIRLRNGVQELELLPGNRDTVAIHDTQLCELIRKQHEVEVYWYRFSKIQLVAVFSAIRVQLWNKLGELDAVGMSHAHLISPEDIMEPLPNSGWFGFNLRGFWRRLKGPSKA